MADTNPAPAPGGRKTYPNAAVGVFAAVMIIGFGLFQGAGILMLGPAIPWAFGTWRWGLAGFVGMIPVVVLIIGGCWALIARGISG